MPEVKIIQGDCREKLTEIASQSIHCCVTSPPYWGLRDYGCDKQIGIELSIQDYISELVLIFKEVRRVLRDDGTLWLNLGDAYVNDKLSGPQGVTGQRAGSRFVASGLGSGRVNTTTEKLKPKNLIGLPWRVAFALQDDGWILRQDIIWSKPNPTPESVIDRCTKAHEYVFLFSKNKKYYYDYRALLEPAEYGEHHAKKEKRRRARLGLSTDKPVGHVLSNGAYGRNKRSVWTIPLKPFKGLHFATYPEQLAENCILAGSCSSGVVLDPFAGSGTTLIVAAKNKRQSVGIELNPEYCEIIKSRLQSHLSDTGKPNEQQLQLL